MKLFLAVFSALLFLIASPQAFAATLTAGSAFVMENDGTMRSSNGEISTIDVAKAFYKLNPDGYDLILIIPNFDVYNDYSVSRKVFADLFPSPKLLGIQALSNINKLDFSNPASVDLRKHVILHELSHTWGVYLPADSEQKFGVKINTQGHWATNVLVSDSLLSEAGGNSCLNNFTDQGNMTVERKNLGGGCEGYTNIMDPIAMYLAGFMNLTEAQNTKFIVLQPGDENLNTGKIERYLTAGDLAAAYGSPAAATQTVFNLAVIALSEKNLPFTDTQIQKVNYITDNLVSWFSSSYKGRLALTMNKASGTPLIQTASNPAQSQPQNMAAKYSTGSLVNDKGTVYLIRRNQKIPFTNAAAFLGLGYSFKNVVSGDTSGYNPVNGYMVTTAQAAHPWGSWLLQNGTVYYAYNAGLIPISTWDIFIKNGGSSELILPMNTQDLNLLSSKPIYDVMTYNDSRVYRE